MMVIVMSLILWLRLQPRCILSLWPLTAGLPKNDDNDYREMLTGTAVKTQDSHR